MTWTNRTSVSTSWNNRIDGIIRDETGEPILDELGGMLLEEDRIRYENRTNVRMLIGYNGDYPYNSRIPYNSHRFNTTNWQNR